MKSEWHLEINKGLLVRPYVTHLWLNGRTLQRSISLSKYINVATAKARTKTAPIHPPTMAPMGTVFAFALLWFSPNPVCVIVEEYGLIEMVVLDQDTEAGAAVVANVLAGTDIARVVVDTFVRFGLAASEENEGE